MIIAGGCYYEVCRVPPTRLLLGSGGRAALALKDLSPGTELHTFFPSGLQDEANQTFSALGIRAHIHSSSAAVWFEYAHAMGRPRIWPLPLPTAATVSISGDVVLGFGCLEGQFELSADRVVFDPQGGGIPRWLTGSAAQGLALVLNKRELQDIGEATDLDAAAARLMENQLASTIVVKNGPFGAIVYDGGGAEHVPAYCTRQVYKIGSGDVFSAVFAHAWGEKQMTALDAADFASRQAAQYVETNALPCPPTPGARSPIRNSAPPVVAVCGPSRTFGDKWLANEILQGLEALGVKVDRAARLARGSFDPRRVDVALFYDTDRDAAAASNLQTSITAGIPCVVLGDALGASDAIVEADLSTALYRTAWRGQHD
jgi:hypothetical protein